MRISDWSSDVCSSDLPFDQHARIAPSVPHRLQIGIELIDQRRDRQHRAVGARFLEREAQVLAHPVDREAEVELALRHRAPAVDHLPARRGAARYRLEHLVGVEPRYRSEEHTSELQSLMRLSYAVF